MRAYLEELLSFLFYVLCLSLVAAALGTALAGITGHSFAFSWRFGGCAACAVFLVFLVTFCAAAWRRKS